MTSRDISTDSSGAWSEEETLQITGKSTRGGRASAFVRKMRQEVPEDEWTAAVKKIARVAAKRGNGYDTVLIVAGHEEKLGYDRKPHISVIERYANAGIRSTGFSRDEVVKAVAVLYRYSPNCLPAHREVEKAILCAEVNYLIDELNADEMCDEWMYADS